MKQIRNRAIQTYIKFRFPGWRIDWIAPDMTVLTRSDGRYWLVPDKREAWSWMDLAQWLVPAVIYLWSAIMVSGVVLG